MQSVNFTSQDRIVLAHLDVVASGAYVHGTVLRIADFLVVAHRAHVNSSGLCNIRVNRFEHLLAGREFLFVLVQAIFLSSNDFIVHLVVQELFQQTLLLL